MTRKKFISDLCLIALGASSFSFHSSIKKYNINSKVIIIGSGITSLCLGALLANLGYNVTVLEANKNYLGGHSRTFEIDGLKFTGGPQYVWNFGENQIGWEILKELGLLDEVKFTKLNEKSFEKLIINNCDDFFTIPMGLDNFKKKLIDRFPKEKNNILRFFNILKNIFESVKFLHNNGLYLESFPKMRREILFTKELSLRTKYQTNEFAKSTLKDIFDYCDLSENIRRILYGHGGIFVENESTISFGFYAAATGYYHNGAYYPTNGFESIINALVKKIEVNGGKVLLNKKVEKLVNIEKNIIKSALVGNEEFTGDIFISSLSPRLTSNLIYGHNQNFKYQPSNSMCGINIGIKKNIYIEGELKDKNIWWQDGNGEVEYNNVDILKLPRMLYVGSNSAKNYGGDPLKTSLTIYIPSNYIQFKEIHDKDINKYIEIKNNIIKNVIDIISKNIFIDFEKHILFSQIDTPIDFSEIVNAEMGSVYGRRGTTDNILNEIKLKPKFDNLIIACSSIGHPGIAPAFKTAKIMQTKLAKSV